MIPRLSRSPFLNFRVGPGESWVTFRRASGIHQLGRLTHHEVVCSVGGRLRPLRESKVEMRPLRGGKRPQVQQVRLGIPAYLSGTLSTGAILRVTLPSFWEYFLMPRCVQVPESQHILHPAGSQT